MTSITPDLAAAISLFGEQIKNKLAIKVITGQAEEQLRSPLDAFLRSSAESFGFAAKSVEVIGEVHMADVASRPDFVVTVAGQLTGFVELKAPGKGADPRAFRDQHDADQAKRLLLLPNVLYSDGQSFSLWQNGQLVGQVEHLIGDVASAGVALTAPAGLPTILELFFRWAPIAPRNSKELATISARLCRLLRDEVSFELSMGEETLRQTAEDWRHLLFPDANDEQFADGYAQAVTFGLLIARAKSIDLNLGIDQVAKKLGSTNSLIGRALAILGDAADKTQGLEAAIGTLQRVLSVVEWSNLQTETEDAWLYFYEHFLEQYDKNLRKRTGSYYTPPEVVRTMTRWTDEAISDIIGLTGGIANKGVTVVDPAMGTGTYLLEVLKLIASRYVEDLGEGAQGAAITEHLSKLIGFEIQLGPYAVAQLRLLAELSVFGSDAGPADLRTFVANTLSNPYAEDEMLGAWYEPIALSRKEANRIKREEDVLVVLGNPPYKEKSKGEGSWVESGSESTGAALLKSYLPPKSWKLSAHTKHIYNQYVYFWRWATWKAFDSQEQAKPGVVAFITVAGFLRGPGFQAMREKLREQATDLWIIDCTPEGLQAPVASRIFQAVPHEICIVIAVRRPGSEPGKTATASFRSLKAGRREDKFAELAKISLTDDEWLPVSDEPRSAFSPIGDVKWTAFPLLESLFIDNSSGVMPGRTWVYAPDVSTLQQRWNAVSSETNLERKRELFSEHTSDRRVDTVLRDNLPGYNQSQGSFMDSPGTMPKPVRFAFRSFDRQWLIPDKRLINRANPGLWKAHSDKQIFLTALNSESPSSGPAVTFAADLLDIDHYHGRAGRVYSLWLDSDATVPNFRPELFKACLNTFGEDVNANDLMAYIAAVVSTPGYTSKYRDHLDVPGLRVPLTGSHDTFKKGVKIGRRVIWTQTYGGRSSSSQRTSSYGSPRLTNRAPVVQKGYPIPVTPEGFPNVLSYDPDTEVLSIGEGRIEHVTKAMRNYEISGVNVLDKWFSYRKQDRTRPVIGSRRVSDLLEERPDRWLTEYTTDLIDLLNVLGLLIALHEEQAEFIEEVAAGAFIDLSLPTTAALPVSDKGISEAAIQQGQVAIFDLED